MKRIFYLILFFLSINSFSQNSYLSFSTGAGNNSVYKLDLTTNTLSFEFDFYTPWGAGDIAISSSGTFYCIGQTKLQEIDNVNGTITVLSDTGGNSSVALTCSNNNELFYLDGDGKIYKYDINTNTTTLIINSGKYTPGDITFYKGNIIFQNIQNLAFTVYNLANGTVKDILCISNELNYECIGFYGISTIFNSCGNQQLIGITSENKIYEIDIDNQSINYLNFDTNFISPYIASGMASDNEYLASNCTSINFTEANCSNTPQACNLTVDDFNKTDISIYPNPTTNKIYINNLKYINNLAIYNLNGSLIKVEKADFNNSIDMSSYSSGIYLLKIENNNTFEYFKIIKQ